MKLKPIAALLVFGPLLAACNDSTSNSASGTARPGAAVSYDFFVDGQDVYAINRRASKPAPVKVDRLADAGDPKTGYLTNFQDAHWLFSTASFGSHGANNIQTGAVLYVNGAHFYRLISSGSGTPAPQQVSAEAQADRLCEVATPHLLRTSLNHAEVKYRLPGKDGRCGGKDDIYKRIRLNMSAIDAPESIQKSTFFAAGIIGSNDNIKWYLALDGDKLVRYDAKMGSATTLLTNDDMDELSVDAEATDGKHSVIRISGGEEPAHAEALYVIDNDSGVLSKEIKRIEDRRGLGYAYLQYIGAHAGQHYYLVGNGNTRGFIRFAEAGGAATTIASGTGPASGFAGSHLVYTTESGNTTSIKAIDVSARNPAASEKTLKSGINLANFAVAQGRIFYNQGDAIPTHSFSAGSIKLDGSGEVNYPNARWVGYTTPNSFTSAFATPIASRLVLAKNLTVDAQGFWSGGELHSVPAGSAQLGESLGKVPPEVGRYSFISADYGGALIGHGYSSDATKMHLLISNQADKHTQQVGADLNRIGWLTDWLAGR